NAAGRFGPGNKFGKGNPFYRRQAALRQALLDEVGEDGLQKLARKLLELALAGDVAAARTLLAYVVGRPRPAAGPDRCGRDEMQLIGERPADSEVILALIDSAPPGPIAEAVAEMDSRHGEAPREVLQRVIDRRSESCAPEIVQERQAKRKRRKRG